jgi:hypothetical protein
MLNSDGTVNDEAYMSGRNNPHSGIRRIVNPGEEDQKENGEPLGDVVWPLMLLLCAYAGYKKVRARKEKLAND